jgi:PPOX class probable F420-dependent enzyme
LVIIDYSWNNVNAFTHIVPIWFVLDKEKNQAAGKIGDIIFTTYEGSVKARNIERDSRVCICVDDQTP